VVSSNERLFDKFLLFSFAVVACLYLVFETLPIVFVFEKDLLPQYSKVLRKCSCVGSNLLTDELLLGTQKVNSLQKSEDLRLCSD